MKCFFTKSSAAIMTVSGGFVAAQQIGHDLSGLTFLEA
jgi:hypothetical protein